MAHVVHEAAPVSEYVPTLHDTHTELEVAPMIDDHVPALQFVHRDEPNADDHVPALQLMHDAEPAMLEYVPTAHLRHVDDEVAPMIDDHVPAAHCMHDVVPGRTE